MLLLRLLWLLCVSSFAIEANHAVLKIQNSMGKVHPFSIELALTGKEKAQGLMYRSSLDKDHGMLFVYKKSKQLSMWMKNTKISLDMIFIKQGGNIDSIAESTTPYSLKSIRSISPCIAVLEVNAGTVKRLNIHVGDKVIHPFLNEKRITPEVSK